MYSPARYKIYLAARKELTTFAVITVVLIVFTIINACWCAANFGRGLKPYVVRRKVDPDEEKPYGATELVSGPAGAIPKMNERMTID